MWAAFVAIGLLYGWVILPRRRWPGVQRVSHKTVTPARFTRGANLRVRPAPDPRRSSFRAYAQGVGGRRGPDISLYLLDTNIPDNTEGIARSPTSSMAVIGRCACSRNWCWGGGVRPRAQPALRATVGTSTRDIPHQLLERCACMREGPISKDGTGSRRHGVHHALAPVPAGTTYSIRNWSGSTCPGQLSPWLGF
jgi:hypothetical protein